MQHFFVLIILLMVISPWPVWNLNLNNAVFFCSIWNSICAVLFSCYMFWETRQLEKENPPNIDPYSRNILFIFLVMFVIFCYVTFNIANSVYFHAFSTPVPKLTPYYLAHLEAFKNSLVTCTHPDEAIEVFKSILRRHATIPLTKEEIEILYKWLSRDLTLMQYSGFYGEERFSHYALTDIDMQCLFLELLKDKPANFWYLMYRSISFYRGGQDAVYIYHYRYKALLFVSNLRSKKK